MAWIFSLSAECGPDESEANLFTQHFNGMTWMLSNGRQCQCRAEIGVADFSYEIERGWRAARATPSQFHSRIKQCPEIFQDIDENWWCRVSPINISEISIESSESAYLMTELGILFYQHLQSAPAFRYALVGVEVDEFRTYGELLESPDLFIPGLVLALEIGQEIGLSPAFRPFKPGYVWQPYEGEIYNPLMVSPDLKSKLNEILAVS